VQAYSGAFESDDRALQQMRNRRGSPT
jgi:hypothetical protein